MKKLFFLSLILTGLGSAATAQVQLKKSGKKSVQKQSNASRTAEKMRIENQSSMPKKAAPKKVVVVTPRAEVMVTQDQK